MADKRIIELTNEKLLLSDGDMTIVDSESGTYKYDLNRLAKKTITDTTLSVEGKPADAKAVGDALSSVDVDTVNNARQLLSEKYVLDREPYLFRASGGDGADRVEECIVGGTVAWNQLCDSASVTITSGHKYISKVGSTWTVGASTGSAITSLTSETDMVIDLTTLFGSTIADYIYSLEQATAGAGVAWFRKYFPDDYYEYSAPALRHVEGVSAKQIRDADDNVTAIYPLDSTLTLRGIPKLTDGKMWFDGDRYNADGTVERRYGIVDLGTLNWTYTGTLFSAPITGAKYASSEAERISGLICDKYPLATIPAIGSNTKNKTIVRGPSYVAIKDDDYSSASVFKTAVSGVYLVYELATPTTESATHYTALQTLDPNGTEEFVSTGIVPVGHESHYLENLRSKIEGLPKDFSTLIAPTEATYKATRNYTSGSLLIVGNILYKATANIANGATITPNTNCTATTLAAVIAAL